MSRSLLGLALVVASMAAGCASTPEGAADTASANDIAAAAEAASDGATANAVNASGDAEAVDAQDLASADRITCREMLKQGSNVIINRCMTPAAWKSYERLRERDAQEVVRMMQGSAYRR